MSPRHLANCTGIEIFNWRKGSNEWETSWIRHGDHNQPTLDAATEDFDVTIFHPTQLLSYYDSGKGSDRDTIIIEHTNDSATNGAHTCRSCIEELESSFEFLSFWWEPLYLNSNGYFGCQDELDENNAVISVSTGGRFLIQHFDVFHGVNETITHKWRDIIVFTNWVKATKRTKILFLRTDVPAIQRIIPAILHNLQSRPTSDPLWPYITIIDDYLNLQHTATYAIRDLTEAQEKRAEVPEHSSQLQPRTDYARLHEIARHALTVTEILNVNVKTLDHIVRYHEEFIELEKSHSNSGLDVTVRRTHQRLLLYAHMIYSLYCRCSSYQGRMKNVIELAFNIVSQDEAHTSVEIAKATKADSQAMKITSLVALVFLPPTFISAVFSTTFFNFGTDEDSWEMSKKFYIYWAFVLPITIISVLVWYRLIVKSAVVISMPKYLSKLTSRVDSKI